MSKNFICLAMAMLLLALNYQVKAQEDTSKKFKPGGKLWGYAFGDYDYKPHADTVGGGRGGNNQYSKVPKEYNQFQFRRIYLGYNYDISEKFSAEFLLAAEDNVAGGDLLGDSKFAPYVKLANVRWKNIWPGTDLVFGQVTTPSFSMSSEPVWGYRSIERMAPDIRRTLSFDFGVTLQGKIIPKNDNYGYNLMIGNGTGARPENDRFKWFYGDVYAKFLNKRLIVDFYMDYNRMNWNAAFHRDRCMAKLLVAYNSPKFAVGAEGFITHLMNDNIATRVDGSKDTITTKSSVLSMFARGRIYKDKLGFFARYDVYNPAGNIDNNKYIAYSPLTSQYDPNTKEQFITAGLDFTPVRNVHVMPNIWYNAYRNAGPASDAAAPNDYDMVYRLTFYYIYGK
jgi:hypothetical protein